MLLRLAIHGNKVLFNVFCRNSPCRKTFQCQCTPMLTQRDSSSCAKTSNAGAGHKIVYKPYTAPCPEDHDYKNMRLDRPMSPHLTIYAPTMTAMTSILQRITGTILTMSATFLSVGALFLTNGVDTYVAAIQSLDLSSPLVFIIKFCLAVPFTYHYFNGIRYVAWSMGKWLSIKAVYLTANIAFILGGVFAFILASM